MGFPSFLRGRLPSLPPFLFCIKTNRTAALAYCRTTYRAQSLSPAVLHTRQSPITSNAPLHPITRPDTHTFLCDSENHSSPHNLQTFVLAVTVKAGQKEGRSSQQQVDLFLISMLILVKASLGLYNPPAEGGGNTQWQPLTTEPRMEITQTNHHDLKNERKLVKVHSEMWKSKPVPSY